MKNEQDTLNEQQAAKGFGKQSLVFDDYDRDNTIIHYKRSRVRDHVLRFLPPKSHILELNSGTGTDAIFFAEQGHTVHATDISEGMQKKLKEKIAYQGLTDKISAELCSFTELISLKKRGPYDLIFSNFAGLNCTRELDKVLRSFGPLLKQGGQVTLTILPPFSIWESGLLFRGRARTAFRRFLSRRKGAPAHVEGFNFRCWYYNASYVKQIMAAESFEFLGHEGLCTIVPPSYIEHFAERHPRSWRFLSRLEDKWKSKWPWRNIGDYYIISFRKK
jgi:ubiquinone/menaquinone biosynthesis C-methylase UbiE